MILAFALMVMVNGNVVEEKKSYWYNINRCQFFAKKITNMKYRSYHNEVKAVYAYCIPEWVNAKNTKILR